MAFLCSEIFSAILDGILLKRHPQVLLCIYEETHLTDKLTNK